MTKLHRALNPNVQFDSKQVLYLEHHAQRIVQSYWQDLLTQTSIEQNKDSLCSHDAGRIINPILQQIVSGRHKSLHSFRRTLKVMLRSVGASEEINNNYTDHKHGGSDQES